MFIIWTARGLIYTLHTIPAQHSSSDSIFSSELAPEPEMKKGGGGKINKPIHGTNLRREVKRRSLIESRTLRSRVK